MDVLFPLYDNHDAGIIDKYKSKKKEKMTHTDHIESFARILCKSSALIQKMLFNWHGGDISAFASAFRFDAATGIILAVIFFLSSLNSKRLLFGFEALLA